MRARRRTLQVSLDDKTLTGLVNTLSERLHKRDELDGIARVSRGGMVRGFVDAHVFAAPTEIYVAPLLPGISGRRIQVMGYSAGRALRTTESAAWFVETSEDFSAGITMVAAWTSTPLEIIQSNPTDAEGAKFVRTLGWMLPLDQGAYIPLPSQIGLLDPGHGVGLIAGGAGGKTDRYQGIFQYRELLANMV